MLSSTIQLGKLGLRIFVAFVATAFLLSPQLSAQGIGDRINKVGDRVVDKTKKGVDTRINQRVSKVNSKIDKSIDKALDPKTYKKKRKAAQKAEKDKQKGMTKEERKARKQELKAQDKIERDNRKARKAKEKAEWRAYKAGYIGDEKEDRAAEIAEREATKAQKRSSKVTKESFYNSFIGSFQYDVRYHSTKVDEDGKQTLTLIPEKHYLLSIDADTGKIVVHTKNASLGNQPEYIYMTQREEIVTILKEREDEDEDEEDLIKINRFFRFNFIDINKKTFWANNYTGAWVNNDSVFFEGDMIASDTINGVEVTRYIGENDLYKIELWADNSRRLNTIHAFNTTCRFSRRRPDLYALQPIHMMRVPVLRARIYHKNTKEVCIMTMQNFSTIPPPASRFNYPSEPALKDLLKADSTIALPIQDDLNRDRESAEWQAFLKEVNFNDLDLDLDLDLGLDSLDLDLGLDSLDLDSLDLDFDPSLLDEPTPTPTPVTPEKDSKPNPKAADNKKQPANKPK